MPQDHLWPQLSLFLGLFGLLVVTWQAIHALSLWAYVRLVRSGSEPASITALTLWLMAALGVLTGPGYLLVALTCLVVGLGLMALDASQAHAPTRIATRAAVATGGIGVTLLSTSWLFLLRLGDWGGRLGW